MTINNEDMSQAAYLKLNCKSTTLEEINKPVRFDRIDESAYFYHTLE